MVIDPMTSATAMHETTSVHRSPPDNRGSDLFVTLIYRDDIAETLTFSVGNMAMRACKVEASRSSSFR